MFRTLAGSAALVLAAISGAASAQEGAKFDCPFAASAPAFRASLGEAMVGQGDPAVRSALVEQLRALARDLLGCGRSDDDLLRGCRFYGRPCF